MPAEVLTALPDTPYLEVHLARVVLVSAPDMGWFREESSRYLDVHHGFDTPVDDTKVGEVQIRYDYSRRRARLHTHLYTQKQGIGTEIYTAVPFIPLPCGTGFAEAGFTLYTDGHNNKANGLWRSLVRKGLAREINGDIRQYEMLPDIPPPSHLEVFQSTVMLERVHDSDEHIEQNYNRWLARGPV